MISNPILIVDDEVEMRIAMSETLKHCGYPVELSHNAIDALKKYKENDYSMVITDMTMPKRSGLELLKDIKRLDSAKPVIMATAYATVETAVEAMKHGAFDYIKKPIDFDSFLFLVERALAFKGHTGSMVPLEGEPKPVKGRVTETSKEIVTQNQEMLNLLDVTQNIAKSKATVLIQSESGTGKELLAHYIHDHSERAGKPFVAVNCAALPDTLLESELFGYKKGAFTGANQDHRGKFEQAHTGTILLDEISEMALPLQAKLLRVLQEHEIDKVGGKEPVQVDVRVVATTNRGMLEMVESGKFREDLYFRLNVIPLALPALRERMDDLPVLVEHFLDKHSRLNKRERPTVSPETMAILRDYRWRGNVRELENVVERALLLCDGKEIKPHNLLMHSQMGKQSINQDLARATASQPTSESAEEIPESKDSALGIEVGMSMKEAEKKLIFETLRETGGNRTKAAKILGISIRTLRNKLNEYRAEGEDIEVEAEN
ncbi:MAG: sigma-54 dependent transcriptional regulator [SAR324 cluster bacterium]|jgi:DNA-binding NtrC family response regulator|nr:sigma-54 dependent transcriptional regulator [SAR324 cluster bacterium]|tara:strand:- start:291 stop:1763 length:1473 start_codon:yes stop_codon:yes gene_type:complete